MLEVETQKSIEINQNPILFNSKVIINAGCTLRLGALDACAAGLKPCACMKEFESTLGICALNLALG